jgi:hypothetical protein
MTFKPTQGCMTFLFILLGIIVIIGIMYGAPQYNIYLNKKLKQAELEVRDMEKEYNLKNGIEKELGELNSTLMPPSTRLR